MRVNILATVSLKGECVCEEGCECICPECGCQEEGCACGGNCGCGAVDESEPNLNDLGGG